MIYDILGMTYREVVRSNYLLEGFNTNTQKISLSSKSKMERVYDNSEVFVLFDVIDAKRGVLLFIERFEVDNFKEHKDRIRETVRKALKHYPSYRARIDVQDNNIVDIVVQHKSLI